MSKQFQIFSFLYLVPCIYSILPGCSLPWSANCGSSGQQMDLVLLSQIKPLSFLNAAAWKQKNWIFGVDFFDNVRLVFRLVRTSPTLLCCTNKPFKKNTGASKLFCIGWSFYNLFFCGTTIYTIGIRIKCHLDCTVRALHIFVILFNRLAIFNRDTLLFRAAKVFYARCSCCSRCSCCGRCGYCTANERGLLLANFSSERDQHWFPLVSALGCAFELLLQVKEARAFVLTDTFLPWPARVVKIRHIKTARGQQKTYQNSYLDSIAVSLCYLQLLGWSKLDLVVKKLVLAFFTQFSLPAIALSISPKKEEK